MHTHLEGEAFMSDLKRFHRTGLVLTAILLLAPSGLTAVAAAPEAYQRRWRDPTVVGWWEEAESMIEKRHRCFLSDVADIESLANV